jgi:hypothetical protein
LIRGKSVEQSGAVNQLASHAGHMQFRGKHNCTLTGSLDAGVGAFI